jgi:hypothetical protein
MIRLLCVTSNLENELSLDFYELLLESPEFCNKLGKLTLLAGKLESELKALIFKNGIDKNLGVATLGKLKTICKDNSLVNKSLLEDLEFIHERRNYLTHRLFPLFNNEINITLLPRDDLSDIDAEMYFPNCVDTLISYVENTINQLSRIKHT